MLIMKLIFPDKTPCYHKGCLNHISHPCEGCGRVRGQGNYYTPIKRVSKSWKTSKKKPS